MSQKLELLSTSDFSDTLGNDFSRLKYDNINMDGEDNIGIDANEELIICHINDSVLNNCPHVDVFFGNEMVNVILDSGAQVSVISERVYNKLLRTGMDVMNLPINNVVLLNAFGGKTSRIKKQVYLEFTMGSGVFEHIFLVSPQLVSDGILGSDFAIENKIIMDFDNKCIRYLRGNEIKSVEFSNQVLEREAARSERVEGDSSPSNSVTHEDKTFAENHNLENPDVQCASNQSLQCNSLTETLTNLVVQENNEVSSINDGGNEVNMLGQGPMNINEDILKGKDEFYCSLRNRQMYEVLGVEESSSLRNRQIRELEEVVEARGRKDSQFQAKNTQNFDGEGPDPRSISVAEISTLVSNNEYLDNRQKESLIALLTKYAPFFTSKPGKCKVFEYEFRLSDETPAFSPTRPVPYSLRPVVREQIRQLIEDDVLEIANSPHISPLTIVHREGKAPRICVDARKINSITIPDRERTPPLNELLQKFHGVRYMTSIDLSSAFLQIPLKKKSRQYTAFLFDSTVYQYKRVPYGFRNSLSAFVRALKLVLDCDSSEFVIAYVDDVLVHSRMFAEHMAHLNLVLSKVTNAGFTVNASKCRFCQTEVTFLGHKINQLGVSPDPQRIAAILNYPAPRNQKQLRQFLGTCNFHSKFIVGYANYVGPLVPLLKKGTRWTWTDEKQLAFATLREQFARSIQLVHPDATSPYCIYTDACRYGISGILLQRDCAGKSYVVSTTSRVLSATERNYSVCEQELLAVVNALQKFRLYIFGQHVTVYTDNKALSFMKRCTLISNRITRWIMQIQEYDLEIVHVKGTDNFLADVMSRNPVGLTSRQIEGMSRPREFMVTVISLDLDPTIRKTLKELSVHQTQDRRIEEIKQKLTQATEPLNSHYKVEEGMLYCKGEKLHKHWRPYLPSHLESQIIKYVHHVLGHAGTDKCVEQLARSFYIRNLGRKVRKFVAGCDVCQQVKHPNRS